MIDSTRIDELIVAARSRDNIVTGTLLGEIARLAVMPWTNDPEPTPVHAFKVGSGIPSITSRPIPENGSYAYQLYWAICFAIDARAELKLLELIASPTFYDALMRSAAEIKP